MPDILTVMDDLLTSVISAGRAPEHWLLRQSDWEEIARRFEEKEAMMFAKTAIVRFFKRS